MYSTNVASLLMVEEGRAANETFYWRKIDAIIHQNLFEAPLNIFVDMIREAQSTIYTRNDTYTRRFENIN